MPPEVDVTQIVVERTPGLNLETTVIAKLDPLDTRCAPRRLEPLPAVLAIEGTGGNHLLDSRELDGQILVVRIKALE